MSFLNPFALWFLAALPVIVALYLRRLQRRPASVSTLFFWQRLLDDRQPRALFQRLRQWLSLLLHLLIFLLILAALARPLWKGIATSGSSLVLILDTRARMQASEPDGQSRWQKAGQLAAQYTAIAGGQREVTLLAVDRTPRVVVPFTDDESTLSAALRELRPTDSTGSLEAAVTLGRQLLASRPGGGEIIALTAAATELSSAGNLQVIGVGTARENLAITRFGARALPASPQTFAVYLELANFSPQPAQGSVEIALDGRLLEVQPYRLAAGERTYRSLNVTPAAALNARGWLTARLDRPDALALDNAAYVALPPPTPKRVLLVTKGNLFLEKALQSNELIRAEILAPDAFRSSLAANFDVVIFDRFVPPQFNLSAASVGHCLFIHDGPFAQTAMVQPPLVTDLDAAHPLLRLVEFQSVTFLRGVNVKMPADRDGWHFQAPLRAFDAPLILAGERVIKGRPQRIAMFAFDVAETDLPLRVAFPLLMSNAVQWLSADDLKTPPALATGETMALPAGTQIWNAPQRTSAPLPAVLAPLINDVFQPQSAGFYLARDGQNESWLASNLFNTRESDLQSVAGSSATVPVRFTSGFGWRWPLWIDLALLAFALFAVEWWLYHRRRSE